MHLKVGGRQGTPSTPGHATLAPLASVETPTHVPAPAPAHVPVPAPVPPIAPAPSTEPVQWGKRSRKAKQVTKTCDCGGPVTAAEREDPTCAIECGKVGCESGWVSSSPQKRKTVR